MLKSSELRIGNWVHLPSKGKDYQILSGHDIEEIEDSGDAEGIQFDNEKLLSLGFQRVWHMNRHEYVLSTNVNIEIEVVSRYLDNVQGLMVNLVVDNESEYPDGPTSINYVYLNHIKYVHQLQNLYFALTGEELELVTTPQHS